MTKDAREKKYGKGEYIRLGNCPHEFGGSVQSTQFAGSRAMMRSCNLMIGIEGNKDPELPEDVRNIRCLTILEDREFGNSDSVQIYWNRNTTLFREV
jgi:twinkle protein